MYSNERLIQPTSKQNNKLQTAGKIKFVWMRYLQVAHWTSKIETSYWKHIKASSKEFTGTKSGRGCYWFQHECIMQTARNTNKNIIYFSLIGVNETQSKIFSSLFSKRQSEWNIKVTHPFP